MLRSKPKERGVPEIVESKGEEPQGLTGQVSKC